MVPNERLLSLLERWHEARALGNPVAVSQLCAGCPELAADLQRQLDLARQLESLAGPGPEEWPATVPPPSTLGGPPRGPAAAPEAGPVPAVPGYEGLSWLGEGGMGTVYRARDSRLGREVALKLVRPGQLSPDMLARLLAEARAVARLDHPHVVKVFEVGEYTGPGGGPPVPYLALELVAGGSLEARLGAEALPPAEAARLVMLLARAAQHAHERGIVHRDLKPGNVLLAADGSPKIADFGLAKQLDLEGAGQTQTGAVMGTPEYMAPEQAQGHSRQVGPAADVYALGGILYRLLSGRPPFKGASVLDTLMQVQAQEPAPLRARHRKVPRDLETVCLKCLEKQPARRYAGAQELADDLERFLNHEPIRARRAGLLERAARWARRRPAAALAGLVVLLALTSAAGGLWLWQRMEGHRQQAREAQRQVEEQEAARQVTVEYYTGFVRRFGLPEGVGPVSAEQARRRNVVCKAYRRGGAIERVDVVNGLGQPVGRALPFLASFLDRLDGGPENTRACSFRFLRDAEGKVTEESAHDQADRLVWKKRYTSPTTAELVDAQGLPAARAAHVRFTLSREGLVEQVWYLDRQGRPQPNRDGARGERREHDERGLLRRITWLDTQARPAPRPDGTAGVACRPDAAGRWVEVVHFGPDGQPRLNADGYAKCSAGYDGQGNAVEHAYFGPDGKAVLHEEGYHKRTARHDDRGNQVEVALFGLDGKPTLCGEGYQRRALRHDEWGRVIETAVFAADGRPVNRKAGWSKEAVEHGPSGQVLRRSFWRAGPAGELVLWQRKDGAGRLLENVNLTADGRPQTWPQGHHRWVAHYDNRGSRTEEAYFGLDGKPTLRAGGYHKVRLKQDQRGNQTEWACFGLDGSPCRDKTDGTHRATSRFDERGNRTEMAYFGTDGRPCLHEEGYHRWVARFDDRGNRTEMACFGTDGRPLNRKAGWAKEVVEHGPSGKVLRRFFWRASPSGELVLWQRKDGAGRLLERVNLTADGRPQAWPEGHHRWTARYDERGNQTEYACFGMDGRPCLHEEGYHRWVDQFDERGRCVGGACFGVDGQPALHKAGHHRWAARFDEQGHRTERAYFAADGSPVNVKAGWSKEAIEYGPSGRVLRRSFWKAGPAGELVLWQRKDGAGRLLESVNLTADGRPQAWPEGHHRWTARYDERGNQAEYARFGLDGQPTLSKDGYARATAKYDERGNKTEVAYFGLEGKPALHREGHARWTARYDGRGNRVEVAYFGLDGRPTLHRNGYARLTWAYGEGNRPTDMAAFDTKGSPVELEALIASVTPGGQADRLGLRVGDVLLRYDGKPVANSARFGHGRRSEAAGGAPRSLEVLRQGKTLTVAVSPGLLGITMNNRAKAR